MNIKIFVKKEKTLIVMVSAMMILLVVTPMVAHGQTAERFLNEDQSMVCKHERHLGPFDSNELVCATIDDDDMPYSIFEQLMIDHDTYPIHIED